MFVHLNFHYVFGTICSERSLHLEQTISQVDSLITYESFNNRKNDIILARKKGTDQVLIYGFVMLNNFFRGDDRRHW